MTCTGAVQGWYNLKKVFAVKIEVLYVFFFSSFAIVF